MEIGCVAAPSAAPETRLHNPLNHPERGHHSGLIFVVSYSFDASPHAPGVRVSKVTLNALSVLAFGLLNALFLGLVRQFYRLAFHPT